MSVADELLIIIVKSWSFNKILYLKENELSIFSMFNHNPPV